MIILSQSEIHILHEEKFIIWSQSQNIQITAKTMTASQQQKKESISKVPLKTLRYPETSLLRYAHSTTSFSFVLPAVVEIKFV